MVKAKIITLLTLVCVVSFSSKAQDFEWSSDCMDGSRTGCTAASETNVEEALGRIEKGSYIAPNGRKFKRHSATANVASIVIGAQPEMLKVKKVIAFSDEEMPTLGIESRLTNWYIDILMDKVAELSGKRVDIGISNYGGVRADMPKGDVILDDILSMFPFKNNLVYIELKGRTLRTILEDMASTKFEILGGVSVIVEDDRIISIRVGDRELDDEKIYSVATISFLLNGGDRLSLAKDAVTIEIYDMYIKDAVLDYVDALTARGEHIRGKDVGRVIIR